MTPEVSCPDCAGTADVTRGPDGRTEVDFWHGPDCPSRQDGGAAAERWADERLAGKVWLPDYSLDGAVLTARHHLAAT